MKTILIIGALMFQTLAHAEWATQIPMGTEIEVLNEINFSGRGEAFLQD